MKGRPAPIKDKVVSLFPDLPSRNDKEFHKEGGAMKVLGLHKGCEEVNLVVPLNVQVSPAFLAERAIEEKMERGLFPLKLAEDTVVVVTLNLEVFPLENVSGVQSIHQQQPGQSCVAVRTDDLKCHVQPGEVEWIVSEASPLCDAGNHHKHDVAAEL